MKSVKFEYWKAIIEDAFNFNMWGHWVSSQGLTRVFNAENKRGLFAALKKLGCEMKDSTASGSFMPFTGCRFYYTPLFKPHYWQKVYDVKKQVPIVQRKENKEENFIISHTYQMLLGLPLIPEYHEYLKDPVYFAEYKDKILTKKEYQKLRAEQKKQRKIKTI